MRKLLGYAIMPALVTMLAACEVSTPTMGEEFGKQLEGVAGSWSGQSFGGSPNLTVTFTLSQASNGNVTGSGTMREGANGAAVPISVTGTFHRPALTLTFGGIVYDGRSVTGSFRGDYTSIAGISAPLQLKAEGYDRSLTLLVHED